jgi:hypothetical protein
MPLSDIYMANEKVKRVIADKISEGKMSMERGGGGRNT